MSEIQIPQEILNKILNIGGVKRDLYCSRCKKYTEHVQVSYADTDSSLSIKIMGRFADIVPLMPTLSGNPFACKSCGKIRYEGGFLSDLENR